MTYDLYSQIDTFSTKMTMSALSFLMERGQVKTYGRGEVVAHQGEVSDHVYFVIDGQASVEKTDALGSKVRLAMIDSGELIGEMSAFLDKKRTATIVAYSDLQLIEFQNEAFINALPKTPDLTVRLVKSLAQKLSQANQDYFELAIQHAMMKVGMYLIDTHQWHQPIEIDIKSFCKEHRIKSSKVIAALKNFLKLGVITPWTLKQGRILSFTVDFPNLRNVLNQI